MIRDRLEKLEIVRGGAALYIFLGHLLVHRLLPAGSIWGLPFRLGQEAVILFFLLSGFVIHYSTALHADTRFSTYFGRRFRRIYPIFLLALLAAYVSQTYTQAHPAVFTWPQLFGNLVLLQDFQTGKPGVWFNTFCGNDPLWSLSYEWWFYMMFFPLYRHVPSRWQVQVVALLAACGYVTWSLAPNTISTFLFYFLIWWAGVELSRAYLAGAVTFRSQRFSLLYLALATGLLAGPVLMARAAGLRLEGGIYPVLELRHFAAALGFVAVALAWHRASWRGFQTLFGFFAPFAPISYGIYVLHSPLAAGATYLDWIPNRAAQMIGYLVITFFAAQWAEGPYQRVMNRLLRKQA